MKIDSVIISKKLLTIAEKCDIINIPLMKVYFFVHFYALKKCFGTQRISSGSSREGGKWSVKAPNTNAFIKHNRRCRYESKDHTGVYRM